MGGSLDKRMIGPLTLTLTSEYMPDVRKLAAMQGVAASAMPKKATTSILSTKKYRPSAGPPMNSLHAGAIPNEGRVAQ